MPKKDFSTSDRLTKPVDQFLKPATAPAENPPKPAYKYPAVEEKVYPPPSSMPEPRTEADHWEPRTRRVHLIMKPSVYSGINHMAKKNRQSFNHFVETLLEAVLAEAKRGEAKQQGKG